jgi:hypothetical protein
MKRRPDINGCANAIRRHPRTVEDGSGLATGGATAHARNPTPDVERPDIAIADALRRMLLLLDSAKNGSLAKLIVDRLTQAKRRFSAWLHEHKEALSSQ